MGKIKIIGGTHRSRVLTVVDSEGLRPTLARIRETLFNWLGQDLTGKTCLDLFAGSGALGFESISRNATMVTMIEKNKLVANNIKQNMLSLKAANAQLIVGDALAFLANSQTKFDIIYLDPPFNAQLFIPVCKLLHNVATKDSYIYVEFATYPEGLEQYLTSVKQAKAGNITYGIYQIIN